MWQSVRSVIFNLDYEEDSNPVSGGVEHLSTSELES